jgi:hypothetical protein
LDKKKKIEDKRTIKKELTYKRGKQKRERERMDKNNGSTYFVGKRELLDRKRKYLERSKRERERLHKRKERKKPDGKRNHKTTCKEVTERLD